LALMNGPSNLSEEIFDSAGDAIIFADRTGTIRRWNRAAAALFGFAAQEALGQASISSSPSICVLRTGPASMRR